MWLAFSFLSLVILGVFLRVLVKNSLNPISLHLILLILREWKARFWRNIENWLFPPTIPFSLTKTSNNGMIFPFPPLKLSDKGMQEILQNNLFHFIHFSSPKWSVKMLFFYYRAPLAWMSLHKYKCLWCVKDKSQDSSLEEELRTHIHLD